MADRPQPELSAWGYLRLVLLGAVIGIPAALVAVLVLVLIHDVEHWLWHDLPHHLDASSPPWYLVVGLPVVGAGLVVVARRFLPGDGGHSPLDGFGGSPPLLSHAPGILLAAVGTLSFGAVLGPEGPLIALGAVVGILVNRLARLGAQERALLANAGSFSAISAIFGGPIVGGVLMMEGAIGFGASTIAILLPGFVAAGFGYLVFVGFGNWGGLDAQAIAFTGLPAYDGVHPFDVGLAIIAGALTALVVAAVRWFAFSVSDREQRVGMPQLLLLGGLTVGLLAQTADWLGANPEGVLFSGQAGVPALVAEDSAKVVLILLVAKAIAYAICLGCGFRGGPVFPAVFLGTALAMFAVIWFDISPTLAVAVGAAAGMASMTRMLLTSILFAALLVGPTGIDAVPAAVAAAATAWLVVTALERRQRLQDEAAHLQRQTDLHDAPA